MSGRLRGKIAIVTGAASGFGAEFTRRFAAGVDIDEAGGRDIVAEVTAAGGTASFHRADITRADEVRAAVAHAVETYGGRSAG